MTRRIGVFGGTFDPPHIGHSIAATAAAEACDLELVLWVPTGESYHKALSSPAATRVSLVRAAIAGDPRFALSEVDVRRAGPTFSIDTVLDLESEYPDAEFTLILGDEAWRNVPNWHRADELVERVRFVVVSRMDSAPQSQTQSVRWVSIPTIAVSSSECRARIREGLSVRYWLRDSVFDEVERLKLYREDA